MIFDLSGKEKSALLWVAGIAPGLMGEGVEAPGVPRPDSERPLSAEETVGFAVGDPFGEHGLVAAGKRHCRMCSKKAAGKGVWLCSHVAAFKCPYTAIGKCPGFSKKPSTPRPPQPKKKGLPVPEGVKFFYFGRPIRPVPKDDPWIHQGIVTVAWITPAPGVLHMGFAFCSPEDLWCKATGRNMAMARLLHPLVIPCLYSPERTVHEVVRAVLTHDFGRLAALTPGATMWGRVPSWTKALSKRLMGGTERERRGRGKALEIEIPLTIITHMMRDIAALGNNQ